MMTCTCLSPKTTNGRKSAQVFPFSNKAIAAARMTCDVSIAGGDYAVWKSLANHFRTPSPDGQHSGFTELLPVYYSAFTNTWRDLADGKQTDAGNVRGASNWPVCLPDVADRHTENRSWISRQHALPFAHRSRLQPVVTRSRNKPQPVGWLAQAPLQFSTETWAQARSSAQQVASFIARPTPSAADPKLRHKGAARCAFAAPITQDQANGHARRSTLRHIATRARQDRPDTLNKIHTELLSRPAVLRLDVRQRFATPRIGPAHSIGNPMADLPGTEMRNEGNGTCSTRS